MRMAKLSRILTISDMRKAARKRLPKVVFDYVDGAVEDELGVVRNTEALNDIQVNPHYMIEVHKRDQVAPLFDHTFSHPFGIAPTGMSNIVWPDADACLARAAKAANIPYCLITVGSTSIEEIGRITGGDFWFQLYPQQDRSASQDLIRRARDAGAWLLMVTVDVPLPAKRERDIRNGFIVPPRVTPKMLLDGMRKPNWAIHYTLGRKPHLASLTEYTSRGSPKNTKAAFMAVRRWRALGWEDLEWLRKAFDGPLLLKGILSVRDAKKAVEHGVDGLVVSNHGGRQLDAAPATIDVLPAMRDAIGPDFPLIFDSGVRRGSHIAKALALGANFVLVGRATLYGAGVAGQPGVERSIEILADEIDRFQAQTGAPTYTDLRQLEIATPLGVETGNKSGSR